MSSSPTTVVADSDGRIAEWPGLIAAGGSGRVVYPLEKKSLIPLPEGSRLYLLPKRLAVGFGEDDGRLHSMGSGFSPVAAFLPPGYTATALASYIKKPDAPSLPLYSYCAVCWHRGQFHVPAIRVDDDPKHDPCRFDKKEVAQRVRLQLKRHPHNRLLSHHGLTCALQYGCPNAANLFLRRWEAPVAVSGGCNAACVGCISYQPSRGVSSPQERIGFVPTVDEIVELAAPHLEEAPRAMISFGQGCEGEPLLRGKLIEAAIREIRRRTCRGTIHINTNGSKPAVVARLAEAGLNSIRISLNSAREPLYSAYYRCSGYSLRDVMETFSVARKAGLFVSVNYLTFPGVTDDKNEFAAFSELLAKAKPNMIQWRNLNIDPDTYIDLVDKALSSHWWDPMGITTVMRKLRRKFPHIRFGYFNPPTVCASARGAPAPP